MNSFFFLFLGIPAIEIFLLIKIGAKIGALMTISLIFLTALIGLYFAKLEGIKTIRTGVINLYQHKNPVYEIFSGASIAIASGEEKKVPNILKNYEFLWRLRTDFFRRLKRIIETFIYYIKGKFIKKIFKKTRFIIIE